MANLKRLTDRVKNIEKWIEQNATHTWQDQQGYYLNRSGKKEL